jgi:nucleoside-diphosphate-sugar epimerase
MKVLITGAFGNLGLMCVNQAIELGYEVTCFDLDTPKNQQQAGRFGNVTTVLGDIRDTSTLELIIRGVDAIIHNASVLPPTTDNHPELAKSINVDACKELIRLAEGAAKKPVFIFPSSVTVFGEPKGRNSLKHSNDPVNPTDNYTQHKVAIEQHLEASNLDWVVLRVGVSVDARTLATDYATFKKLLNVDPENPLEYVHPKDVAFAMCKAAVQEEAFRKVLLIGGGPSCQINQYEFLSTAFTSLGLRLPLSVLGKNTFYTHWMDTAESQRILSFQNHSFNDYIQEMDSKLKLLKYVLFPLRGLINRLIPVFLKH